jgi:hypothetical protein
MARDTYDAGEFALAPVLLRPNCLVYLRHDPLQAGHLSDDFAGGLLVADHDGFSKFW